MARVIIVDDIDVVRLTLRKFLERGGHEVTECATIEEAEQSIRNAKPDVVITDLWMPGRDGLQLISVIKAQYAGLPIIAVTGGAPRFPQRISMQTAAEMGADRVLIKPVGMQELLSNVADVVNS